MSEPIRITTGDLFDPKVDEAIEREQALKMLAERAKVGFVRKFVFSSVLYTAVVGMIGGFLGWAILEPFYGETTVISGEIKELRNKLPAGLELREGTVLSGVVVLEKTNVIFLKGMTKIENNGEVKIAGEFGSLAREGIKPGVKVRFVIRILGENLAYAARVIVDPPPAPDGEPGEPDLLAIAEKEQKVGYFIFALVGGMIALMIGAVEGIVSMNLRQSFLCGIIGLGIGFAGGLVGLLPTTMLYSTSSLVTNRIAGDGSIMEGGAFFSQIVGRSLAWGLIGMALALGQGVARKSGKMAVHGLIGGCLGGLFAGMLFDPIGKIYESDTGDLSRGIGFSILGLMIGLFTGIVEQLSKEAWLLM
ncbi:MAG: hypothetical protein IID45_07855, partial [Planctomycetes bacterium]|nr:hypothetical protein [Planctomycetota bacterium]